MGEAFLKALGSSKYQAESAGLEPGLLNPLVVKAMDEVGIDISSNVTKDVFELHKLGKSFNYVITVCDPKASDLCPVFPGLNKKINWAFEDPSKFIGTEEEKMILIRKLRDKIKNAVEKFIAEY